MSRRPLALALVAVIAAAAAATSLARASNPTVPVTGLSMTSNVESTGLFCTGLGASGSPAGRVVFTNTADRRRTLDVRVDANGAPSRQRRIELASHATTTVTPTGSGHWYGVSAVINGAGVVADVVAASGTASVPCVNAGVTDWYASGLDTLVGSRAYVVLYNPSATAAVVNVSMYTRSGFLAPAPFQGVSIGARSVVALDLGTRAIDLANVGVHVRVLRSTVVATAVQESGAVTSFDPGTTRVATTAWFPRVTTVLGSVAQIRVSNPSEATATVTATVGLAPYRVAPTTITVPPFSTGLISITPNPAVPAHGYATVTVRSSVAVAPGLATGTTGGVALSAPNPPSDLYLVSDFTGRGFDAVTATNVGAAPLTVSLTDVGTTSVERTATIPAGSTMSLRSLVASFRGRTFVISAPRDDLIVSTTLPSRPVGGEVVAPLYGG